MVWCRAQTWMVVAAGLLAMPALAHRADPEGHASEKWPRFSLARPAGSAPNDAPLKEGRIGSSPKVGSTFGSDALAHRAEKWTRFSASNDALIQEESIDPKSGSIFGSDALAHSWYPAWCCDD